MARSWASLIPASREAPSIARSFVESKLGESPAGLAGLGEVCDDLVVIVSELVTNAVQAASASVRLELELDEEWVRLAVTDFVPGMPAVSGPAASDQPFGRGLAIVAILSADWGVTPAPTGSAGKTVWARLDLPVAS